MRRAALVSIVAGAAIAACGLDESGVFEDAGGPDADLPEACSTLDAACLGALDPMWTPVTVADGGCGAGWSTVHLATNPHDTATSCACGACSVVGAYACDAGVVVRGGNTCTDQPPVAVATPGVCANVTQTQHIEAYAVTATGSVGCFAANDAGTGAAADDLAVCVPGCSADFCGAARQCVMADGDVACPSGFQLAARAGTGTDPGCAPCPCEAGPPPTCDGTITAYFDNDCDAGDEAGTYGIQSGCNYIAAHYKSVLVELAPPDASCAVTGTTEGDASLTGVKTICCR